MQQYKDFEGNVGSTRLKGESGRLYGTPALYSPGELAAMLADGIVEYTPPPPPPPVVTIPSHVTRYRLKLALQHFGKWDAVSAFIKADPELYDTWLIINDVARSNPLITQGLTALGITAEEADQIFLYADSLEI